MRSSTETIIAALRILAVDIQSEDGVANACVAEAADRLEELSKAQQEPVAWASPNVIPLRGLKDNHPAILTPFECAANTVPLYTTPPKRQPLSDDEILKIGANAADVTVDALEFELSLYEGYKKAWFSFARAIEKAHGIE